MLPFVTVAWEGHPEQLKLDLVETRGPATYSWGGGNEELKARSL